jgi:glycosyltransferase involved in cell wall biosynthesis
LKIAKQFNPDIIHTNVSVTAIGYYVARLLHIPHIWHIREYADKDFNFHYFPSKKIKLSRYKHPNSYTICITKDIQQHHELDMWSNSAVIYNGIFSQKELFYQKHKQRYFLFAGRLEEAKGILPLIDAYADYCKEIDSPLPLHIAGSGTNQYMKLIQNKISQYNIQDHIVFLGMRNDILSLYREAIAIIVPSISEGFGRVTAEAMFAGCLVIGNDTAGTKEQFDIGLEITGEEIGLRYTTRKLLIQHMINVTSTPFDTFVPMILRGQKTATALYSTEQHAKHIYEFYKKITLK